MSENWEKRFDEILDGIDKDECDSVKGWWETSDGAKFGAKKKAELKEFIQELIFNTHAADEK